MSIKYRRSPSPPNAPGWVTFNVRKEDADEAEHRLRAARGAYWDDDERCGDTVEAYLTERHESAELDEYLEIGDEVTLTRTFTLNERWRITNDVPWQVERVEP